MNEFDYQIDQLQRQKEAALREAEQIAQFFQADQVADASAEIRALVEEYNETEGLQLARLRDLYNLVAGTPGPGYKSVNFEGYIWSNWPKSDSDIEVARELAVIRLAKRKICGVSAPGISV